MNDLTVHAMKDDRDKCTRAGCDYATRPIDRDGLTGPISQYANNPHNCEVT